jgi:hypothetical protein
MRKAEKVEGLRFALSPPRAPFDRKAPALDEPRLLRVQYQIELPKAFLKFSPEPFGVVPVCEADNTTMISLHLTHKGHEDAYARLNTLMQGLLP